MIRFFFRTFRAVAGLPLTAPIALVLTLCPPATAAAQAPSEESVKALILAGKTAEATVAARQMIASSPTSATGHVLLANALLRAATAAAQSLPPGPDGRPATIASPEADVIAKELEAAIQLAPERKDLYLGLIELDQRAGRDDDFLKHVDRAARTFTPDTGLMGALLKIADGLLAQGAVPVAGSVLEKVYASYKEQPDAVLGWASYLVGQGDLDRAVEVLRAAAAALPKNFHIQRAYADTQCYQRDFRAAAQSYARAVSADPSSNSTRLAWAAALHVNDPRGALVVADPVWGHAQSVEKSRLRKLAADDAGNKAGARIATAGGLLFQAITRPTFRAFDAHTLARSLWQSGFAPQALAESEVALSKDSALLEAWMLRVEIYQQIGLTKQALEAAERAETIITTTPGRPFGFSRDEVLTTLALAQVRAGKREEAFATYARTSDPSRYDYPRALIAEELGRIEQARGLLEKVIAGGAHADEVEAARARLATTVYRKGS